MLQQSLAQTLDLVATVDWPIQAITATSYDRAGVEIAKHDATPGAIRPLVVETAWGYGQATPSLLSIQDDDAQESTDFRRRDRVQIGLRDAPERWQTERAIVAAYDYQAADVQVLHLMDGLREAYPATEDWHVWNCRYAVVFTADDVSALAVSNRLDVVLIGLDDRQAHDTIMFDVVARLPRLVASVADLQARWLWLYTALQRESERTGVTIEERLEDAWSTVLRDIARKGIHPARWRDQRALVEPTLMACRWLSAEQSIRPHQFQDGQRYAEQARIEYYQAVKDVVTSIAYIDKDESLTVDAGEENLSRRTIGVQH